MRILTQNELNDTFGKQVVLINYDSKSSLVLSKYEDITEPLGNEEKWMIHKVCTQDDCRITLEDGSYLDSFEDAIMVWLKRTNKKFQIEIPFEEEDIRDMDCDIYKKQSTVFDWTFDTKEGISVDVKILVGQTDEDEEDSDEE